MLKTHKIRFNLGFKNNLWILFILSVTSTLPIGLTPEIPTNQIFAQSIDLNINSIDVNKSSNSNFTHNNNLTSNLLFGPELNLSSNMSAAPGSSSLVSSVTNEVKGDFNGDGFDDLAIGVPGEGVITEGGTVDSAGAVNVIYGSPNGLSATSPRPDQFLVQGNEGISGFAEASDIFSFSLAAADINGDGKDDLAIGVPGEDVVTEGGIVDSAGAVNVIYGSSSGLSDTTQSPDQFLVQGFQDVDDVAEANDLFGYSLSAADFNGDGKDDLVIGVPGEGVITEGGTVDSAGAVNVIYGSPNGLSATSPEPDQFWTQDTGGIEDVAEAEDSFGFSLVAADFNGDGKADLSIGIPNEDLSTAETGAVNVIYGSPNGLSATSPEPDQFLVQGNAGVDDVAEANDLFGYSLSAANFNGDKINGRDVDDLAIGVVGEDAVTATGTITDAGAVNVIYGSPNGLSATSPRPDQFLVQGNAGVDDVAEAEDFFSISLNADDFNGDGKDDLTIGVHGEDIVTPEGTILNAGAVNVIYGSPNGLSATSPRPDQFLVQGNAGVNDVTEADDLFGFSLG
jgi:hypothetical protein